MSNLRNVPQQLVKLGIDVIISELVQRHSSTLSGIARGSMPFTSRISPNDLAAAEDKEIACKAAWGSFNYRQVTDQELNDAKSRVTQLTAALTKFNSFDWKLMKVKSCLWPWGWLVGGLAVGALGALAATILVLNFGRFMTILAALSLCFLLAGSTAIAVLLSLPGKNAGQGKGDMRSRLRAREESVKALEKALQVARDQVSMLGEISDAEEDYQRAAKYRRKLVERRKSRRYQLMHSDWPALRGTPFEYFHKEVFEVLGYSVKMTKPGPDQGVDLVVTGKGRAIAVQAKGWAGSVGNSAISEVVSGMRLYGCTECVVVTNSHFTGAAIEKARANDCVLIEGKDIPRLIEGAYY